MKMLLRSAFYALAFCTGTVLAKVNSPVISLGKVEGAEAISRSLGSVSENGTPSCKDRAAWLQPSIQQQLAKISQSVDSFVGKRPVVPWSEEIYLAFQKTGDRKAGEAMMQERQKPLLPLVLAECMRYDGKYLLQIQQVVRELLAQPTWVLPAHDRSLATLRGRRYFVDINSAEVSDILAQTIYLLSEKLPADLKKEVERTLEVRTFSPMRRSFQGEAVMGHEWLLSTSNWVAVCLEGVTSAALFTLTDRNDRGLFIAAAKRYISNYLAGFDSDGYASEGIAYWNYGYGHFLELRDRIVRSTSGSTDLFQSSGAQEVALFGFRASMFPGNVALFGDAPPDSMPDYNIMVYVNMAYDLKLLAYQQYKDSAKLYILFPTNVLASNRAKVEHQELRHYFKDAEVLVSRPQGDQKGKIALTVKGGGNSTHSHNDVGSYTIALGASQPVGDPGGMRFYNAASFGKDRFKSKFFNSFGHPVPVVAGHLQVDADRSISPPPVETAFSALRDKFIVDLTGSYDAKGLESLVRSVTYERLGVGSVSVEDKFLYSKPQSFETAITTRGSVKRLNDNLFEFRHKGETLRAKVQASADYEIVTELVADGGSEFTRLGIRLREPTVSGFILIEYSASE